MAHDIGDVVGLGIEVKNSSGTLVNSTPVALTVTLPDATTSSPSPTNPSTGSYEASYTTTQAGRHTYKWTVGGSYPGVHTGEFHVRSAVGGIVGLDEAKKQLNIVSTYTDDDDELRSFIDVVSQAAEDVTGQVFRRQTIVATCDGGEDAVLLTKYPVISITSVTESGTALAAGDYSLDATAGLLWRRAGTYSTGTWAEGHRNIVVTYAAGMTDVPAPVRHGALLMLDHLWTTQRGTFGPARAGAEDTYLPGSTYSVPNRVLEMWAPYMAAGTP